MFRQSYNPYARLDVPFPMPKEDSPRARRKSLAQRLEEQDRKLQQLSFEGLPFGQQHQSKDEEDVADNNSLNSCPPTICVPQDNCDLLDYPDSPMTHPPRTVIVRTGDPNDHPTPRRKNRGHRSLSIDFSTICTDRGEDTSLGEEEDLSEEEDESVTSFDLDNDEDNDEDGDDGWDEAATFSTYPPTSIMFVHNHLDVIATPQRSRTLRSCSDLSGSFSSLGHNAFPPKQPSLAFPKLEEPELQAQDEDEYESSYKLDVDEETDEDDGIPHVMSCPEICGDEDDEDDFFDFPLESYAILEHSIETISCPGRLLTNASIDL